MLKDFYTLVNFNFIKIYIIHKISVSLKITRITLKILFSNSSLFSTFFLKTYFFSEDKMMKGVRLEKVLKNRRQHN